MPQFTASAPDTQTAGYALEVCSRRALAHTDVSVVGVLDTMAVAEVDDAVRFARAQGHTVTLDLHQVSGTTSEVRRRLLGRKPVELRAVRRSPLRSPRTWSRTCRLADEPAVRRA